MTFIMFWNSYVNCIFDIGLKAMIELYECISHFVVVVVVLLFYVHGIHLSSCRDGQLN